jgi:hypothetical protein
MKETFYVEMIQITAPHFTAGIVFENDIVIRTAPILSYMRGWSLYKVETYCITKKWRYLIKWSN